MSEIKILSMTKPSTKFAIPIINLFGDEEESFYQLGLKDRDTVENSLEHMKALLSTPWPIVNSTIHNIAAHLLDKTTLRSSHYDSLISAYSDGIQKSPKDVQFSLAIPEICAFFSFWAPNLKKISFGCSSFFNIDQNGKPIHTRILDFPLKDTYDKNERIIINAYRDRLKTITFSSSGQPFSGMTSMNEKGLTLAVHQKFTDKFNQHGQPIFYLLHELIHQCADTNDALEFLKAHQSLTCWNFNLVDKNGKILSADLSGKDLSYNTYNIEDAPIYQCNELLDKSKCQSDYLPQGIKYYNEQRKESAQKINEQILKLKTVKKETILKSITSPLKKSGDHISPITLSSVAAVSFSPIDESVSFIPGEAPKIFTGEIAHLDNIFTTPKHSIKKSRSTKHNTKMREGLRLLSLAQTSFDRNDFSSCYHHLQMAELSFDDRFHQKLSHFYFIIVQYIEEDHEIVLGHIQEELAQIYNDLSPYFKDVAKIIDQRICKLINSRLMLNGDFNSKELEQKYHEEQAYTITKHKILKKLTFIHIDVYDVIFL